MNFKKIISVLITFALISQFASEGLDIIAVRQPDGSFKLSELFVTFQGDTFSKLIDIFSRGKKKPHIAQIELDNGKNQIRLASKVSLNSNLEVQATDDQIKALSDEIKSLNLVLNSKNKLKFMADFVDPVICYLVVMDYNDKVIVSDIDGTITKSDIRGHILNRIGIDWTHPGVAKLFTALYNNGYKLIYLSARPKSMVDSTRDYINNVEQDGFKLPPGPIITNDADFFSSLYLEVIKKRPQDFKIQCLKKIFSLFAQGAFKYGIGNKETDAITYSNLDLKNEQIIIINKQSVLISPEYMKGKSYEQIIDVLIPKKFSLLDEHSVSTSNKNLK